LPPFIKRAAAKGQPIICAAATIANVLQAKGKLIMWKGAIKGEGAKASSPL